MAKKTTRKKYSKFLSIMQTTVQRWKDTLNSTAPPDVDRATALIKKANPDDEVFVVKSPLQFYLAQAVIRGRLSRLRATNACKMFYDIDPTFLAKLHKVGGVIPFLPRMGEHQWANHTIAAQTMVMREFVTETWGPSLSDSAGAGYHRKATYAGAVPSFDMAKNDIVKWLCDITTTELKYHYTHLDKSLNQFDPADRGELRGLDYAICFDIHKRAVSSACMSIYTALSKNVDDILNDSYDPALHFNDMSQAEMVGRMCGLEEKEAWRYEIFHCVPAIMRFNGAFLILSERPDMCYEDNRLHNETGPAIEWADGKKEWYIKGHRLEVYGEEIVTAPEKLTTHMLESITNEETRRIAIERLGWEKYLNAINAKVIDSSENWVDNTVEALIQPPPSQNKWERIPLRMLLACRSTGRKYFIAVPQEVETDITAKNLIARALRISPEDRLDDLGIEPRVIKIADCATAQNWLAGGAVTEFLPYAKHTIRVVGAS